MKKIIGLLLICAVVFLAISCTGKNNSTKAAKGLEMVKVPGSTYETTFHKIFDQGMFGAKYAYKLEPSAVTIADFEIGKTEITYQTWYDVFKWATDEARQEKRYRFTNSGREGNDGVDGAEPTDRSNHPVTTVDWFNAVIWCNALSEKAGLDPVYYFDAQVARDARKLNELSTTIFEPTVSWGSIDKDAIKRNKEKFPEIHFEKPEIKHNWNGEIVYENGDPVYEMYYGRLEKKDDENISDDNYKPLIDLLAGESCELQEHFKIDFSKNGYRLPTCLEWFYAAKGGKPDTYEWEMEYSGSDTASEVGWFKKECGYDSNIKGMNEFLPEYGTKPVATKKANSLGIYDMSGNVNELIGEFCIEIDNDYSLKGYLRTYMASSNWLGDNTKLPKNSTLAIREINKKGGDALGFRVARNAQ